MICYFQKWSFFLPYTAIGLTFTASFMIIFSTLFNTIYFLNKNSAFNRPKFKMISFKALYISFAFQLLTIGFVHAYTILFGTVNIILHWDLLKIPKGWNSYVQRNEIVFERKQNLSSWFSQFAAIYKSLWIGLLYYSLLFTQCSIFRILNDT